MGCLRVLEGRAKQEVLSMGVEDVSTPGKIFAILEQLRGEHRDYSTLDGEFFRRQLGLTQSLGEYVFNLCLHWAKTNSVQAGTLSEAMLRDIFAGVLHPVSLKIILYYTRIKIKAQVGFFSSFFFTNLCLITNTATHNTTNNNTNHCGKLKYLLRKKKKKKITVENFATYELSKVRQMKI